MKKNGTMQKMMSIMLSIMMLISSLPVSALMEGEGVYTGEVVLDQPAEENDEAGDSSEPDQIAPDTEPEQALVMEDAVQPGDSGAETDLYPIENATGDVDAQDEITPENVDNLLEEMQHSAAPSAEDAQETENANVLEYLSVWDETGADEGFVEDGADHMEAQEELNAEDPDYGESGEDRVDDAAEDDEQGKSEGESAGFTEGYVRLKKGEKIYTRTSLGRELGRLTEDGFAWAVMKTEEDDLASGVLQIVFDTQEARNSGEGVLTGYVQADKAEVLTRETLAALRAKLEADAGSRKDQNHWIPCIDGFQMKSVADEMQGSAEESSSESTQDAGEENDKDIGESEDTIKNDSEDGSEDSEKEIGGVVEDYFNDEMKESDEKAHGTEDDESDNRKEETEEENNDTTDDDSDKEIEETEEESSDATDDDELEGAGEKNDDDTATDSDDATETSENESEDEESDIEADGAAKTADYEKEGEAEGLDEGSNDAPELTANEAEEEVEGEAGAAEDNEEEIEEEPEVIIEKHTVYVVRYAAEEGGQVTRESEEFERGSTDIILGSEALAEENYEFLAWVDAEGNIVSIESTFAPDLTKQLDIQQEEEKTVERESAEDMPETEDGTEDAIDGTPNELAEDMPETADYNIEETDETQNEADGGVNSEVESSPAEPVVQVVYEYIEIEYFARFYQHIYEAEDQGVIVRVTAEKDAFPAGTVMTVKRLENTEALRLADEAMGVEDGDHSPVLNAVSVDITFWMEDEEIEPQAPVKVEIELREKLTEEEASSIMMVAHKDEDGPAEVLPDEAVEDASQEGAVFIADSFSTYTLMAVSSILPSLDTDAAYISDLSINYITGTAPFDANDDPGNDSSASNMIVRSFDEITYTLSYETSVYGHQQTYQNAYIWFRAELPGDITLYEFDTHSMGWMSVDTGYMWNLEIKDNLQVLTCAKRLTSDPADSVSSAVPGSGNAPFFVKIYHAQNGAEIKPTFYCWMDHNQAGGDYDWFQPDGKSGHSSAHETVEVVKREASPVKVSAAPRYNVQLLKASEAYVKAFSTFDFSTGNEKALNKDAGLVKGKYIAYGVTLQLYGDNSKKLKGIEFPRGPITLDIDFESTYTYTDQNGKKQVVNLGADYLPLVWSAEGNRHNPNAPQEDGRDVATYSLPYAVFAGPANTSGRSGTWRDSGNDLGTTWTTACWQGGTWTAAQDTATRRISLQVDGYELNPKWFPRAHLGRGNGAYNYQSTQADDSVEDVWQACFSAAEIFVVIPDKGLAQTYGEGTQQLIVKDVNLKASSVTGQKQEDGLNTNDRQANKADDRISEAVTLLLPGSYNTRIFYAHYDISGHTLTGDINNVSNGIYNTTLEDATTIGSKLALAAWSTWESSGSEDNFVVANDVLLKFDNRTLTLDSAKAPRATYNNTVPSSDYRLLYAYKPDGKGWSSDADLINAKVEDLVYSTTKDSSRVCVGVLYEYRNLNRVQFNQMREGLFAYFTATTDSSKIGTVVPAAVVSRFVRKSEVNLADGQELMRLTDANWSREAYTSQLNRFKGAAYYGMDGNADVFAPATYQNNVMNYAGMGAPYYGDCLLLLGYKCNISKRVSQNASASSTAAKSTFDLDLSQNIVDYTLSPGIVVEQNAPWNGANTTMTVTDTLPKGLVYINGSSVFGGAYVQPETPGQRGSVTGGSAVKDNATTTWNVDGQSGNITLRVENNANGSTTLIYTITNLKVQTDVPKIYFSAMIDQGGSTKVVNNQQFVNTVSVKTTEDVREPHAKNSNLATATMKVSLTSDISLSQTLTPLYNEVNSALTWNIQYRNNSATRNYSKEVMMVTLPHTSAGAGLISDYQGTYSVTGFSVTPESGKVIGDYTIYYTIDTGGYGLLSRNVASDFGAGNVTKAGGVTWEKGTLSTSKNSDGSYNATGLPTGTTAIVIIGPFSAQKSVGAQLTILPQNNRQGNIYWNNVSTTNEHGSANVNVPARIIRRYIEGVVWYDANRDGIRQRGEKLVEDDLTITAELYEEGNSNRIDSTTVSGGAYSMSGMPEGKYYVRFLINGIPTGKFLNVTIPNAGNDDTVDSDAISHAFGTGTNSRVLQSAQTGSYEEPSVNKIAESGTYEYRVRNVDLGLIDVTDPPITKQVNEKEHANLDEWGDTFTYRIQTQIPLDTNITQMVITDTVEPVLEKITLVGIQVKSESGVESSLPNSLWSFVASTSTATVTLKDTNLITHRGAELTITFTANLKADADLKQYRVDGVDRVPNQAKYTLTDNSNATWTKDSNQVTVTPPYPQQAHIKASKILQGRTLKAEEFSFTLTRTRNTTPMPSGATGGSITVKNNANGDIDFGLITYTRAGDYYYTIREVVPAQKEDGMTYDAASHSVHVKVTQEEATGKLLTEVKIYEVGGAEQTGSVVSGPHFTNSYQATGTYIVQAQKMLNGRPLVQDGFTFQLTAGDKTKTDYKAADYASTPMPGGKKGGSATATNAAGGTVSFGEITFTQNDIGKSYVYTLEEVAGNAGGVTYDSSKKVITLSVSDAGNGHLLIRETNAAQTSHNFINTYKSEGEAVLKAKKTLNGRPWKDADSFEFKVTALDDAPMRGTNGARISTVEEATKSAQTVQFDAIRYTQADLVGGSIVGDHLEKTYRYQITEILPAEADEGENSEEDQEGGSGAGTSASAADAGTTGSSTANGITYSSIIYTAVVTLKDNNDGTISTSISYEYEENEVQKVRSDIAEFVNTYRPADVTATVLVRKRLTGREWNSENDSFSFTIEHDPNRGTAPLPNPATVTITEANRATGLADDTRQNSLAPIKFTADHMDGAERKTFYYLVRETLPTTNPSQGITYATAAHSVAITVRDNRKGALVIESIVYDENQSVSEPFENKYQAEPTYFSLNLKKLVNGRPSGEYSFALYDDNGTDSSLRKGIEVLVSGAGDGSNLNQQGAQILTSGTGADGTLTLQVNRVRFTRVGEYHYLLREVIPGEAKNASGVLYENATDAQKSAGGFTLNGVTYDHSAIRVNVHVTDDGVGLLHAAVDYGPEGGTTSQAVFNNTYQATGLATLHVNKYLSGRAWATEDQFTFRLTPVDGAPLRTANGTQTQLTTTANKTKHNPTENFPELIYQLSDLGGDEFAVFTYTVEEVKPEGATKNTDGTWTKDGITSAKNGTILIRVSDEAHNGELAVSYAAYDSATGAIKLPYDWLPTQSALNMTNVYTITDSKSVTLQATKQILDKHGTEVSNWKITEEGNNHDWSDQQFAFVLLSSDADAPMPEGALTRQDGHTGKFARSVSNALVDAKTASFGAINYTKPGTYYYDIREVRKDNLSTTGVEGYVNGLYISDDHLVYSTTAHSVRVVVEDDGKGGLKAPQVVYGEGNYIDGVSQPSVFHNIEQGDTQIILSARKRLEGHELEPGMFQFELYQMTDANDTTITADKRIDTATVDASGIVSRVVEFNLEDLGGADAKTFYFLGTEYKGSNSAVTYSNKNVRYAVTVSKMQGSSTGTSIEVSKLEIDDGSGTFKQVELQNGQIRNTTDWPEHTNSYTASGSASLSVSKQIAGRNYWNEDETYTFELTGMNDAPVNVEGTNNQIVPAENNKLTVVVTANQHDAVFPELQFTQADMINPVRLNGRWVKEFTYRIHEAVPADAVNVDGVKYEDATEIQKAAGGFKKDGVTYALDQTVIIRLTDDDAGNLNVTYKGQDNTWANSLADPQFENHYTIEGEQKVQLKVQKQISGREWQKGDTFTFILNKVTDDAPMPADAGNRATILYESETNSANDQMVSFGEISFTKPGVYVYEIEETEPEDEVKHPGVEYTGIKRRVAITVADDTKGGLAEPVCEFADEGSQTARAGLFTNIYTPAPVQTTLSIRKTMIGRELIEGHYGFDLYITDETYAVEEDREPDDTIGMPAEGQAETDRLTFTDTGKYYYVIRERTPEGLDDSHMKDGVTYSTHDAKVRVEVTDDTVNGKLVAKAIYDNTDAHFSDDQEIEDKAAFTNEYNAEGLAEISIGKRLTGREFKQGDLFAFKLVALEDAPLRTRSDDDGEQTEEWLTAVAAYESADELNAPDTLWAAFEGIWFNREDIGKVYQYQIQEQIPDGAVNGKKDGIVYSRAVVTATVTVEDNEDGTLRFEIEYTGDEGNIITNEYCPEGIAEFNVRKQLVGRPWKDKPYDAYSFILKASSVDAPMPEDAEDDSVTLVITSRSDQVEGDDTLRQGEGFGEIIYTETGRYIYAITEQDGNTVGVSYDTNPVSVVVEVSDPDLNGILDVKVKYNQSEETPTITNIYDAEEAEVTLQAVKELKGRELLEGEFSFDLYEIGEDGTTSFVEHATESRGLVTFTPLRFTYDMLNRMDDDGILYGEYTFGIREHVGGLHTVGGEMPDLLETYQDHGVTYDTHEAKVTVTLWDPEDGKAEVIVKEIKYEGGEAKFVNEYNATGEAQVYAWKKLTGRDWTEEDAFRFKLEAVTKDAPLPKETTAVTTGTSSVDETTELRFANFGKIEFTLKDLDGQSSRLFEYLLTEEMPEGGRRLADGRYEYRGIIYDEEKIRVNILVEDTMQGVLDISVSYLTKDGVFTNNYLAKGIKISKQDVTGKEIGGAKLQILDAVNGQILESWTTEKEKVHDIALIPGAYILRETEAPETDKKIYELAENIDFTVDKDGKVRVAGKEQTGSVVVMVDEYQRHEIVLSKTDMAGKELAGAQMRVTGKELGGREITPITWVSEAGKSFQLKLRPGEYVLSEDKAPEGYLKAEDIVFIVDVEGRSSIKGKNVAKVIMEDPVATPVPTPTSTPTPKPTISPTPTAVPTATPTPTRKPVYGPKTGDERQTELWMGIMGVALLGMIGVALYLKKKREK